MRSYQALLFLCTITLLSCSSEDKPAQEEKPVKSSKPDPKVVEAEQYLLVPGRAGQIAVGLPSDSLKKMVPAENLKTTQRESEGEKYNAFEIRNAKAGNQLLMLAEESCVNDSCKIFRIRIISPKFKTKEDIRVGSFFSDVKKAYQFSYVGLGEADFVALSENKRMAFSLDIAKFPSKPLYKIKAEDIPDSTRVTSILLY